MKCPVCKRDMFCVGFDENNDEQEFACVNVKCTEFGGNDLNNPKKSKKSKKSKK